MAKNGCRPASLLELKTSDHKKGVRDCGSVLLCRLQSAMNRGRKGEMGPPNEDWRLFANTFFKLDTVGSSAGQSVASSLKHAQSRG